ncbi:DUF6114 domain-containing protein [Streptomyces monticola]|uniref:DUF6114 domain-containing protein n=1 Tax=Streptomyces monticola TaxID=2666263 RepID=A0ABW2JC55_9ACTN
MIGLVLGFGAELAKETGAWLDRLLPAPRARARLRSWRRRRPFWAGLWTVLGGLEMIFLPLAPLPLMLKVGVGAMSAIGVGLVLIAGGLFFVFAPAQRMFVSVVTAIASLVSLATTNLGGFGIGVGLGLLGSSMAFGWLPHRRPAAPDSRAVAAPTPVGEVASPKAPESRPARRTPALSAGGGAALVLVLAAGLLAGAPGTGVAAERCREPKRLPWPLNHLPAPPLPWERDLPLCPDGTGDGQVPDEGGPLSPGSGGPSNPAGGPRTDEDAERTDEKGGEDGKGAEDGGEDGGEGGGAEVSLPCLTGVDTGGLDNPPPEGEPPSGAGPSSGGKNGVPEKTAGRGRTGAPDDLTALKPPLVVGDQPGPGRATYPVSPYHPTVDAARLAATDAIIHGSTYLPTAGGGRIKVLWVHAERIVARDYHFEVKGPGGRTHVLDVQLDIRDVDVYATYLKGAIEIPHLRVRTPRICVGADVIPANLPVAVQLPELTLAPVTAGQVLVDAADVRYTILNSSPLRGS